MHLSDFQFEHDVPSAEGLFNEAFIYIDEYYSRLSSYDDSSKRKEIKVFSTHIFDDFDTALESAIKYVIEYYHFIDSSYSEEYILDYLKRVDFYQNYIRKNSKSELV